jgi:hypothetical protein
MKNVFFTILVILCLIQPLKAQGTTLINFDDTWNYKFITETDEHNWGNTPWDNVSYNTFDWNNTTWQTGKAPFGDWNWYEPFSTYWDKSHDLALRKIINVEGSLSNLNSIVNVDDRFAMFINGHQLVKTIDGGAYTYQYDNLDTSYFVKGNNNIDILADDIRKIDWIDMKLTADITTNNPPPTPSPEPSSMLLSLLSLSGIWGLKRKNQLIF